MDRDSHQEKYIRKIEDILDMQKENVIFDVRQVAFDVPKETDSSIAADLAQRLESGLKDQKTKEAVKKKYKKRRLRRSKSPPADVLSWPSDSDITVLRMHLCQTNNDSTTETVYKFAPGDGLHQPGSSSMVNLATLVPSEPAASKLSLNLEECLVPLTSWLQEFVDKEVADDKSEEEEVKTHSPQVEVPVVDLYEAVCSYQKHDINDDMKVPKSEKKSTIARFFRLYFCPCCTCLYEMEKLPSETSHCNNNVEGNSDKPVAL